MEKIDSYEFEIDNITLGFTPKENENDFVKLDTNDAVIQFAKEIKVDPELIESLRYFSETIIEYVKKDLISLYERIDELEEQIKEK